MFKGHIFLLAATLIAASSAGAIDSLFCVKDNYTLFSVNSIVSGDFDSDGDMDPALALSYNHLGTYVRVYVNDGSGFLGAPTDYEIGPSPRKIIPADFDGDDDLDLVVTFYTSETPNGVRVLFNNGDGTFAIGDVIESGESPYQIRAGDLDGDSDMDLAIANRATDYITLLFNDGSGSFPVSATLTAGLSVMDICLADIDHDNDSDLAVANYSSPGFSVFINDGGGGFSPAVDYTTDYGPASLGPTDFDGDGDIDLIVFCALSGPNASLAIYYLNNGDGTFAPAATPPQTLGIGYFEDVVVDDFTNDGLDDFAVATSQPELFGFCFVCVNNGTGQFEPYDWKGLKDLGRSAGAADLDGDGDDDLLIGDIRGFATMLNRTVYPCGDANCDEMVNVGDVVYLIAYIFKGGPAPFPLGAGDANCDGEVNVADGVYLIAYIFGDGPAPCCP